ncbi:hypothetical protein L207DRAFT_190346 [Hyaloscypha variabilis F]|uniref:Uncharacterized protein n=1 Tax=Hyaloscypha variabilis (strain UAMH 11265 / GT02V1 / F) TaxID=1149755 RepID=A0A2J6QZC0_HYAVF|nr:hypothetical protein L207DRAFT_190346 [Hyaloscypha variabilis F]
MSYSGEQYPSVAGQIHFKPHDDLVNDPGYPLHAWPSLERPRRLSLSLHNPNGWKTLPRDYCVVHYPTRPLQEDSKVVKDVTLKMFHSDILKLPDGEIWPRFQEYKDWTASYLNYWYLQGITQSSVENMFKKHFNFSIPLTSTSSAGHWMPAPQLYTVEVQENVWEGRLAIFFHGNVETSFQSVGELLGERGTILNAKHLGQQYVHSWRSKWEKMDLWDQNLAPSNSNGTTLKSTKNTPPRTITDTNLLTPKPRGRKRRALLRQLRTGPSELVRAF